MRRSIQMPEWLNQELKQIAARRGPGRNHDRPGNHQRSASGSGSDGILLLLLVSAGKERLYLPASLFTVFQRKRALGRLDALGYLDRDKETMHSNEVIQSPI